ncbi:TPA: DEAD/DEAH box helicase family protein [Clostridioides difficile]|nr:DNA helicase [Clostridioides difficile]HBF1318173.1 DEAD/DEAH box helicase family protein [Clostridioides difficile]HBF2033088.1 DEAD/DEAH box helicase family protein [Clostridioides difficile]HCU2911556.1 DEAD/DEAH box helicase family protein [Clostridioides difficile]HDC5111180.1 DEAD/DEAH box helicase family protein [Clostridioides difficile]
MAAKYQLITELYRRTGRDVTRNPQAWQGFLSSACRNYKCRFDEQLLIYAQRPDATAVAEIGTWNRLFKRWVNKDSKGIAVFDPKGRRNTLKYYFDVSDTHEGYYGSRPVPIWQMDKRYGQPVMERLADRFGGTEGGDLADFLMQTAENAVEDNLPDYLSQLKDCTENSFLEELDGFNIEVIYKRLAANSVAYMLLSRCGLDADGYFEREDFVDITNFNTPATLNAIGIATSDISEMALREISAAIRNVQIEARGQNRTFARNITSQYDKGRKQPERSEYNERNHLHETGGLSYSRPNITDRARASAWQIRFDAQGLSGAAQEGDLPQPADVGQAERTPAPDRADSSFQTGTTDEAARSRAGSDGGTERESTDAVGTGDERHPQPSGRSDTGRTDLQLEKSELESDGGGQEEKTAAAQTAEPEKQAGTETGSVANEEEVAANLPTIDEQIEMIAEAEDEKSSAFAVSQEDIDAVLVKGSSYADGKYRIYHQFQKREDKKSNIEFLKKEYGVSGGTPVTFSDGTKGYAWHDSKGISIDRGGISTEHDLVLSWGKIEKRLRELIKDNRYLNPKEKDHYADYLESISAPQYEIDTQRKLKRQRFIEEKRELPPADKRDTLALRLSDFIRDLDGYEKDLLGVIGCKDFADMPADLMEQALQHPDNVQEMLDFLALVQKKTTSVYSRSNAWRFSQELTELYPLHYLYHEGDVVYIGADKYEVIAFDENAVSLRNAKFPLFGKEFSRVDFEEKLKENPANDHLKTVITESQKTETLAEEKPDSITFSIGFSEHPAFYDRELNDRFTELSFALGNRMLGVLDEKQHYERLDESKGVGWYKKTDFEIHAVIGGEEFNYEGRFDIGDGEGDLIAHIRNFYEYSLSPNCPFIPEWKRQGEDYYREKMESLRFGQDVFIPFLERHTELTPEDEKLLAEIVATESDWNRKGGDKEQTEETEAHGESTEDALLKQAIGCIDAYCDMEFGLDAEVDYTDLSNIKIAYTATEDGLHGIQASVNLLQYRMETYIDGVLVDYTQYDDLADFIENGLSNLYFHDLVSVTEEQLEPFYREENREKTEETRPDPIPHAPEPTPHYTVEQTSDAFSDPFIIRDNTVPEDSADRYYDVGGVYQTFETEEEAQEYADALNYAEREGQQGLKPSPSGTDEKQDNSDLIGKELVIDNRRYVIESVGKISGDVSMRDVTFQNSTGFPINRVEKIGYVRRLLEQAQEELPPEEKAEAPTASPTSPAVSADRHNYRITNDALGVGGAKEKFRNNMAAIRLLHDLQIENRLATPEEQETLAKYVGWGGLSMAFDEKNAAWANEYKELKAELSDEEYHAAMESTLTAFYTPPVVIKAMYEALDRLGFSQGNILEPSCGTGNFLGLLPDSMEKTKLHGIEIDPISGRIAKQLYQKASIAIEGFEDTKLPDNHFDVVLGNIPFGEFKVNDSRYNAQKFLIHDYFIAKALDKVRAGGIVTFVTSKGTMDKASPDVRKYIAQRAELLGAVRLPDNTFRANAGTEVTSDILILQKRDSIIDIEPEWVHLDTDANGITMNSYFVSHPEMVLGEMKMESTRFGMDSACKAYPDIPLAGLLHEAMQRINGEIPEQDNEIDEISDEQPADIPADPNVRNFSFALVDGKVYFRENNKMTPAKVSMTAENRIKGLLEIRDCVRKLIQYQTDDYPEEMIQTEQKNLNRFYDAFTKKYGLINSRGNYLAFAADESYFLLCSLEVLDDEGKFKRKADMFSKRTIKPHREVTFVETAGEALALSIGEKARVDLEYMARLTCRSEEEIIKELQGVIFKVPFSEPARYVTADEYLSGNVREKLKTAGIAAKAYPELAVNVAALEKVIPKDLPASEISVRLGTTWIPQEDIQQFMLELLTPSSYAEGKLKVRYTAYNGDWFIENKSSDVGNVKADSTYGTKRASAYRIMEDTLNLRDTRIFDYIYDEHNNKKAVLNHKETTAAQAKQEVIKQAFGDWIWKDPERRNRLVRYYNDTFNSIRPREYDGSHITFGGISPEIKLRPHQVNAIAHILYGGNTLLAHKVGAGKTFEMVAAAQESKRLGLCQKSMFVVPNHLVGQWASEYLRLYPSANILVTTKRDFETGNRKKFCGRIATGAYDAVIIGHSQFEKIPISEERQREQLMRQLDDIERGIDDVQASHGEQFTVKQLMKTRKAIKAKLDKLNDTKRKDSVINFEELGIDRLFIDESHFYKNLYLYTKMRNVGGIAQTEAQKSSDLFMKCRYLDEITGSRGVIFATGTPISNSMVEMYSVQRYLQYDTLARNGLQHFDSWASTFGETVTALELSPEGTNYRAKTRFAKFYNLPELMQMFREVADIQTADMLKLPVPKVNYHNIKTKPSEIQTEMVAGLAKRAEKVRARLVKPQQDNMLKITNDGRKLALDQRLIDPMLPDDPESKVNACVDNIYRIWEGHADTKAAQLAFCDLSTPTNKKIIETQEVRENVYEMIPDQFDNVYDDMRKKLIQRGIPAEQVRFIHEATTDAQKKELFAKVRSGEVRVLFGSTPKMGAGTNVQDRLIAIHNLDCPWRPSDLEQRQGRLERQGNMFPEVEVYRYVTEQTFDAYLFQLVEGKQKFISQIMTSKSPVRSAEDVDEVALSFAEVKMLATGDERFKEKMDLDMQVAKLKVLKQSYLSEHYDLEDRILKHYPQEIKDYEERITAYGNDVEIASQHTPQGEDKFCPMTLKGVTYKEKADAGEMLLAICKENPLSQPIEIGSYRGFQMEVFYDTVNAHYCLNLCGMRKHKVDLGVDALGNLTRIENEIAKFPARLEAAKTRKAETLAQLETAKIEVKKPFAFENELKEKTERLNALNIELNLNEKDNSVIDDEPEQNDELSEKKSIDRER